MQTQQLIPTPTEDEAKFLAIYEAAKTKNAEALRNMLRNNISLGSSCNKHAHNKVIKYTPVMLLAEEGEAEAVNFLILYMLRDGHTNAKISDAVTGYAMGGHVEKVTDFLAHWTNWSIEELALGYANAGYFSDPEVVLSILARTKDTNICRNLAREAKKVNPSLETDLLIGKAYRFSAIMNEQNLTYQQVRTMLVKGAKGWLLQGFLLRENIQFPFEIFIIISSFVVGMSEQETEKLYHVLNRNLFYASSARISNNFKSGFFSVEQYFDEQKRLEERYRERLEPYSLSKK